MALPSVITVTQELIRRDTSNPPGNEIACVDYLSELFQEAGFDPIVLAKEKERANLVVRLAGRGEAPPLLFYGHLDVVTTENQVWTFPPFAGHIEDGYLWGRGSLDMKGGVAMLACSLLEARKRGIVPAGDIIYCAVSDEEAGGDFGASFLVDEHPDLFDGVQYAIGEFGGFSIRFGGQTYYPIMVGEKQICHVRATAKGVSGHASAPVRDGAVSRLARFISLLEEKQPALLIEPPVRQLIETISGSVPELMGLMDEKTADAVLAGLGPYANVFAPLLRATVCPTMISASSILNVIPAEAKVDLDCRLLPSQKPDDVLDHLNELAGDLVDIELVRYEEGTGIPDMTMFDMLGQILQDADVGAKVCPFVLSGSTDGRHFKRLGIQTYGFTPLKLPVDFDFFNLAHAPDERVPTAALEFGVERLVELLKRYC